VSIRLSRPSSSSDPYRPQAFNGGPGFWTGKAEKGGTDAKLVGVVEDNLDEEDGMLSAEDA
jgi:hypothetical protein